MSYLHAGYGIEGGTGGGESNLGGVCLQQNLLMESPNRQHSAFTFTCTKCSIHFYAPGVLQDHYRTSSVHPRCRECGAGFLGVTEWATVSRLSLS